MDEYAKKHIKYISLFIIIFLLLTVIGLNINAWLTIIVLGFLIIVFLLWFLLDFCQSPLEEKSALIFLFIYFILKIICFFMTSN